MEPNSVVDIEIEMVDIQDRVLSFLFKTSAGTAFSGRWEISRKVQYTETIKLISSSQTFWHTHHLKNSFTRVTLSVLFKIQESLMSQDVKPKKMLSFKKLLNFDMIRICTSWLCSENKTKNYKTILSSFKDNNLLYFNKDPVINHSVGTSRYDNTRHLLVGNDWMKLLSKFQNLELKVVPS